MKEILLKATLLMALAVALPQVSVAQNVLGNLLGGLTGNSNAGSAVSNVLGALVGNKEVSQESLVGTWTYNEPAIAFQSENIANQVGGALAAAQAEKKLGTALSKYGVTAGKVQLTFNEDGTYTCVIGKKKVSGKYTLSGSTLSLTKLGIKSVKTNVKITGNELQLTADASKLLALVQSLGNVAGSNSSLSTLTSLMSGFDGVNLGLKLTK